MYKLQVGIIHFVVTFLITSILFLGCNRERSTPSDYKYQSIVEDSLYQKNKTPLIVATCSGHKKMVWLLLQYGANQYLKDSSGRNALEWSAVLGNHELMQMLAQSRANFFGDARSKEGKASYASCRNGCGDRM